MQCYMLTKMWFRPVMLKFSKSGSCEFKKQEDFSLNKKILKSRKKWTPDYFPRISLNLLINKIYSKYLSFIWCLCRHIHSPLLNKNMLFPDSLRITRILCLAEVDVEHLQICIFKLFWGTWQTIPREKPDYLVDLEKPIKTGRL